MTENVSYEKLLAKLNQNYKDVEIWEKFIQTVDLMVTDNRSMFRL